MSTVLVGTAFASSVETIKVCYIDFLTFKYPGITGQAARFLFSNYKNAMVGLLGCLLCCSTGSVHG